MFQRAPTASIQLTREYAKDVHLHAKRVRLRLLYANPVWLAIPMTVPIEDVQEQVFVTMG